MTTPALGTARRALAAALLAAVGGLAAAPGARAQYYDDRVIDAVLSPRTVVWRLNRQGFTPLRPPRYDGVSYVVEAESDWGNRVRLYVDARSGAIVGRERLEAPLYPPGRVGRPGYGWTEDEVVVRAPRPVPRGAPPALDAAPSNPFASNYPSRPPSVARHPAREQVAAVAPPSGHDLNPQGLNPGRLGPPAEPAPKRPEPRRNAKLAPPKAEPSPAKPAEAAPPPEAPKPPVAAAPAPAAVAEAPGPAPEKAAPEPGRPAADPARPVRVIGGVTPVPGSADKPGE